MTEPHAFTPASEIETRIAKLQHLLREDHLDGALVLQNTDLFYFAGTIQQSYLYIPADGRPILMVHKNFTRAQAESALRPLVQLATPGDIPKMLRRHGHQLPRRLGLECDVLPAAIYFKLERLFDSAEISDVSPTIRRVRAVKSEYEIERVRKAAGLADRVAAYLPEVLREGLTEIELAGLVEAQARKWGHQGTVRMRLWGNEMFYGHLMAGPAAAQPSFLSSPTGGRGISPAVAQGASDRPIGRREPILLDYVFALDGYLADHTRIFALGGLDDELLAAHAAMLDVQALIKQTARPGVSAGKLYDLAHRRAAELGYEKNFMGAAGLGVPFVGHGIGLELDEYPFLARRQTLKLEANMVIAVEPKAVFPGKGVVGTENTFIVKNDDLEQLTCFEEGVIVV